MVARSLHSRCLHSQTPEIVLINSTCLELLEARLVYTVSWLASPKHRRRCYACRGSSQHLSVDQWGFLKMSDFCSWPLESGFSLSGGLAMGLGWSFFCDRLSNIWSLFKGVSCITCSLIFKIFQEVTRILTNFHMTITHLHVAFGLKSCCASPWN